jgi:hypothetical protein
VNCLRAKLSTRDLQVRSLERERDKLRTCMTLDRKTIARRTEQRDRYKEALEAICGKSSADKSPRQRLIDINHALKRLARAALASIPKGDTDG